MQTSNRPERLNRVVHRSRLVLSVLALAPMLASTGCLSAVAPGESIEHRTLAKGHDSALTEPLRIVIDNAPDWEAFWEQHTAFRHDAANATPTPEVDFSAERVVAVFLGQRGSGGWGIQVTSVTLHEDRNVTILSIATDAPDPRQRTSAAMTEPHHILAIPHDVPPVVFEERSPEANR